MPWALTIIVISLLFAVYYFAAPGARADKADRGPAGFAAAAPRDQETPGR